MTTILPRVKIDPSPNDIIPDDTPIEMLKPDYDETVMDDTQIINDRKRKRGRKGPRACHKHGLVDCTLDRCPLPKGYGYVSIAANCDSNMRTRIWFSHDRIARMFCFICGKYGDHWDYLCFKDVDIWAVVRKLLRLRNLVKEDRKHGARLDVKVS
ncbi:hypothetical protein OROHE_017198 [Orobanche hederae]